jgi:hypothetical protein
MNNDNPNKDSVVQSFRSRTLRVSLTINCIGCGRIFSGLPGQVWKEWSYHLSNCDLGLEQLKWSILRTAILKRDNYTCQDCGHQWWQGLHVHHRIFRKNGGEDTKVNLITLCRACHIKRHHRASIANIEEDENENKKVD